MTTRLLLLSVFLLGCGGGSSAPADLGPDLRSACGATVTDDCSTCMDGSCCQALADCQGDADCTACVTGADGDACERTTATHERVNAYLVCRGGDCASACIGATGASCVGVLATHVSASCQACMEASCCSEVANCKANDGCWEGCFTNFSEATCHGNPDGHALFHAMGSCAGTSCPSCK